MNPKPKKTQVWFEYTLSTILIPFSESWWHWQWVWKNVKFWRKKYIYISVSHSYGSSLNFMTSLEAAGVKVGGGGSEFLGIWKCAAHRKPEILFSDRRMSVDWVVLRRFSSDCTALDCFYTFLFIFLLLFLLLFWIPTLGSDIAQGLGTLTPKRIRRNTQLEARGRRTNPRPLYPPSRSRYSPNISRPTKDSQVRKCRSILNSDCFKAAPSSTRLPPSFVSKDNNTYERNVLPNPKKKRKLKKKKKNHHFEKSNSFHSLIKNLYMYPFIGKSCIPSIDFLAQGMV